MTKAIALLISSALSLGLVSLAGAQTLTNGGILTVEAGAILSVDGPVSNTNTGTLINNGTLQLTGDFINTVAGNVNGLGVLRFSGSQDQTLVSPAGTVLSSVVVDNEGPISNNRLLVPNDLTVNTTLTISKGLVRTPATATLNLSNGATLAGESTDHYVQGNLRTVRANVSGITDFGNGLVLDGTGQSLGPVSVTRTAGLTTRDVSYGANIGSSTKGIDRIWTVEPTNQPTTAIPVTLTWLADNDNGLLDFSRATMWQRASVGTSWTLVGMPGSATTRSLTRNAATLNSFTVSNIANPLPVQLTRFTAKRSKDDALLEWTTASETNSDFFVIEASTDGRTFFAIGKFPGQGTSVSAHAYHLRDPAIVRYGVDLVYYRLRQVDSDGTESFSAVQTVQVAPLSTLTATVWPVPFDSNGLTVTLHTGKTGSATLTLTDALGRAMFSHSLILTAGTTSLPLPTLGGLTTGLYTLSVVQGALHSRLKVVRE